MTAPSSIDPTEFLHEQLSQASPDLLRQMLTTFINTLMSAEADMVCGAEYGERSGARTNTRNGYRHRDFDTRAGTIDVAIPKLRNGSYRPDISSGHLSTMANRRSCRGSSPVGHTATARTQGCPPVTRPFLLQALRIRTNDRTKPRRQIRTEARFLLAMKDPSHSE